jgi:hypothetical protein
MWFQDALRRRKEDMDVEQLLAVSLDLRVTLSIRLSGLSHASNIGNKLPIPQGLASNTVPDQAPASMLRLIYGLRRGCCGGNAARARRAFTGADDRYREFAPVDRDNLGGG